MRNAAEEAAAALGGSMVGRVLEPSPPAIEDGAFFADDPVHAVLPDDVDRSMVVSPFGPGKTWRSIVNERPDLQAWAEARWLTSTRRLPEIPKDYVDQRTRLHRLATYAIAPARTKQTASSVFAGPKVVSALHFLVTIGRSGLKATFLLYRKLLT